ncbi:unnamed protein product [Zymoseptoria tritici ST99CH_1E4]|uniref:Uncharacterized protein n=1 Tax=Zymoseptoria tritici ST99CH_1E4 TaxID=1276532 RepID=A0A2H1H7R9_ZYMTR|nr:unnamed protein product [Zymoseptoria tritici ST99CH_1E4]
MFSKHLFFAAMAFTSLVSEVVASDYQGGAWFCRPAPSIRELRRSYGSVVAQCPTLNAQDPDDQRTYCANACVEFCRECPTSNAKASAVGCFITTVEEGTKLTRCFCGGAYGSKNPPGCQ